MYSTSRDLSIDTNFSFLEPKLINAKIEFNAKRIFFSFFFVSALTKSLRPVVQTLHVLHQTVLL